MKKKKKPFIISEEGRDGNPRTWQFVIVSDLADPRNPPTRAELGQLTKVFSKVMFSYVDLFESATKPPH